MDSIIRKTQLVQLSMLKDVDVFCRKHNIRYSLCGGTLIGAIRHKGFIPWDDDLDICIARPEYERFIKIWERESPKGYILQNKDNTPGFTQYFTKIRKEHTLFLQDVDLPELYHTGIFIDVFPVDRIPSRGIGRVIFQGECIVFQLCTKESVSPRANIVTKCISQLFFAVTSHRMRDSMRKKLEKRIIKHNEDTNNKTVIINSLEELRMLFPPDMMETFIELEFEGDEFMCVEQYDEMLRETYGDYMTLPPENERKGIHHVKVIDFDHDYFEYKSIKKAIKKRK